MWEGGIRVPFLFQWPSKVVGGQEYKEPIISLDIFSTAVAAAGAKMPTDRIMDGVDLLPYLTSKKKNPPHEYLFWRDLEMYKSFGKGFAVRKGKWKLFQMPEDYDEVYTRLGAKYAEKHEKRYNSVAEMYAAGPEPRHLNDRELIHLHDLSVDVGETRNLVKQHPEIVEEMMREYKRWESQLQWPRWERGYWERLPITRLAEFEKKRRSQGKG
jgi:arylsulfatase A-like enzyme